jgi:hypothetical protein
MHGETAGLTIAGKRTAYDPGVFFNSAKFFDLEYQTYGDVPPEVPSGLGSVLWVHPDRRRSIRINYNKASGAVVGFNLLGVRYRQDVCEKWIADAAHIRDVLSDLGRANFDPEFFKQFEKEAVAEYNRTSGDRLVLRRGRGLRVQEAAA